MDSKVIEEIEDDEHRDGQITCLNRYPWKLLTIAADIRMVLIRIRMGTRLPLLNGGGVGDKVPTPLRPTKSLLTCETNTCCSYEY